MAEFNEPSITSPFSGASLASHVNALAAGFMSLNSGGSAPTNTVAGTPWLDTTAADPGLKVRNAADDAWLRVIGEAPIATKGSNYTLLPADRGQMIRCTAALTLSGTAAATLGNGWYVGVLADGGKATIDPNGAETVNGKVTEELYDGESGILCCDGSGLYLIRTSAISDVVIASGTISGGSVAEVVVEIPTEFEDVEIETFGFVPVTDGAALGFQVGTGTVGSPTWQTTYAQTITSNTGGTVSGSASATTYLQLAGASNAAGGFAQYCEAPVKGFNVSGFLAYTGKGYSTNTTPARQLLIFGGAQETTSVRTLLRLIAVPGNIKDLKYTIKGKRA